MVDVHVSAAEFAGGRERGRDRVERGGRKPRVRAAADTPDLLVAGTPILLHELMLLSRQHRAAAPAAH